MLFLISPACWACSLILLAFCPALMNATVPGVALDPHAYRHQPSAPVEGANVPENRCRDVIVVDGRDDSFPTLAAALDRAMANKRRGIGTRVRIAAGLYREPILLENEIDDTDAPLVIEAIEPGSVILTGSEPWTEWSRDSVTGSYTHRWPHRWGPMPDPWADSAEFSSSFPLLVRRGEILFLDGKPLRQVLTVDELGPGRFHVDEDAGMMTFIPPAGVTAEDIERRIEVGCRPQLVRIANLRNVVVRGLTLRHAGGFPTEAALRVFRSTHVLIEDVRMEWNNFIPFSVLHSQHITLRRNTANHNGYGAKIATCDDVVVDGLEVAENNWRGDWAGWRRWDVAGVKTLNNHGAIYRDVVTRDNHCYGFWLDWNNVDIRIERMRNMRNVHFGLYLEISDGPVVVEDSVFAFNDIGIHIANTANGALRRNVVYGSKQIQVHILEKINRMMKNHRTSWEGPINPVDWEWTDNVVVSTRASAPLVYAPAFRPFFETLKSRGNLWHHPSPDSAFEIGGMAFSFADWQAISGQDLNSQFADPAFDAPEQGDFRPGAKSPLTSRAPQFVASIDDPGMHRYRQIVIAKSNSTAAKSYELAASASQDAWHPLDLGTSRWPRDAELLDPILLSPGRHEVHGVPFQVKSDTSGAAAVAQMYSTRYPDIDGAPAPRELDLALPSGTAAIYLLHAVVDGPRPGRVGEYKIHYTDGSAASLVLRCRGRLVPEERSAARPLDEANIQDARFTLPHRESGQAKPWALLNETPAGDLSPRYLYTLEWINPSLDRTVDRLTYHADANALGSVVILGATALVH